MRTPVNDPGPAPKAMPSSERSDQPASASTASMSGSRRSECACPAGSPRTHHVPCAPHATESHWVDVSNASSLMRRILPEPTVVATPQRYNSRPFVRFACDPVSLRMRHLRPLLHHAADDRVARPGRSRRGARRRQGDLRRRRAARRTRPRGDGPRQADLRDRPRHVRREGQRVARRAALPAFRRVRRLHAAARASGAAGRREAARAGRGARAHRPRARGTHVAADRRTGVGLPLPRAAHRAPRREKGRGAGGLPRAQVELRGRHDGVPRACPGRFPTCCRHCACWSHR